MTMTTKSVVCFICNKSNDDDLYVTVTQKGLFALDKFNELPKEGHAEK